MSNIIPFVLWNSEVISGPLLSQIIDLNKNNIEGFFSMHLIVTGTGNVTITFKQGASIDAFHQLIESDLVTPSGGVAVVTNFSASSGDSGKDVVDVVGVKPCRFLQFLNTPAGGSPTAKIILSAQ